ncbi:MAG: glycerophosphodiester phosphodiesterase [Candidatus Rokubacteria bacterium]|nr:glycerophosphodiester phosphodiesterase [Candidatus Rokubacteria bacterium]MBI3825401.1 glycerophosphodiester phosphodiesterase [Candidatus Rokubacteria bacterium]
MKRRRAAVRRWRIALLAVLVSALVAAVPATAAGPLVAAHRGGAALWPENSLVAFRNALALGVDALEFDLHLDADGEVVVIHDAGLARTTTGTGPVRALTRAERDGLRLKARDGAITAERIPTFAQVLDLAAPLRAEIVPEIKVGAGGLRYEGIEEKVLALIRARRLLPRVTIQAFEPETIRRLRALEPGARIMFLVSRARLEATGATVLDALRQARELGATDVGIDHRLVDDAVVRAARESRLRLAVWTVNEEPAMRAMIGAGADMIMTDRPDLLLRALGR